MQRRASSWYGAVMARVGQMSRQAVQLPQRDVTGSAAVAAIGRSVQISPRKNQEPASRFSTSVCLPIQPRPALRASAFSSSGALSANTR